MTMTGEPTAVEPTTDDLDIEVGRRARATGAHAIVGRTAELVVLADAFADLLRGRGRVISVVGEAGMGKSTLVDAFLQMAHDAGVPGWLTTGRHLEQSRPL